MSIHDILISGRKAKLPDLDRKPNKNNAVVTEVDGWRFASKLEAARYGELKLLQAAGKITHLRLQPRFELLPALIVKGEKLRKVEYVADFSYTEDGKLVVEEVKGRELAMWRLKRSMFLRKYSDSHELRVIKKQ